MSMQIPLQKNINSASLSLRGILPSESASSRLIHYGDMDFKVAGTRLGVTALQMNNKAGGITREILQNALSQAKQARMQILDRMEAEISVPDSLSPNAPRILKMSIDLEKIRDVIGPGGKTIRGITVNLSFHHLNTT